jgi:NAD-dependent SIR2 family protein deacetylase
MGNRSYTCGSCGAITNEDAMSLDERGNRVLNCDNCGAKLRTIKVITARPLPDHFQKMPEARFSKRPV